MAKERGDLLQGTLDMLVLKALQLEPMHGWGITERLEQWSEHVFFGQAEQRTYWKLRCRNN